MKFERTKPPHQYKNYRNYRPYTRSDFKRFCAHCFRHEDEAGGEEHFVQDHFEPKCRSNVDPSDYLNLYWSCGACNSPQYKGDIWPSPAELAKGECFCDPCQHDPIGIDYIESDDGRLDTLTPAGAYTNKHIRLSERKNLVRLRIDRRSVHREYARTAEQLRRALETLRERAANAGSKPAVEMGNALAELVNTYNLFVKRDPFVLSSFPPPIPDVIAEII